MMEEMWLIVTSIDKTPIAFATVKRPPHGKRKHDVYIANVCYQLSVESLDFVPSDECVEIWFFDLDDLSWMSLFENVKPVFEQLFSS